jgi:hypothetical protein
MLAGQYFFRFDSQGIGKQKLHCQPTKGIIISHPTRPVTAVSNMKKIIPEPWMWLQCSALLAALLAPLRGMSARLVIIGLLQQGVLLNCAAFTRIPVYRRSLGRIRKVVA